MHKIKDYGIQLIEKLDDAPKVSIQFDNDLWWEGFIYKRDGEVNKKTLKTLFTCGFRGQDLDKIAEGPASGALNMDKEFDLSIVDEIVGDRTIQKVEWVNDPEFSKFNRQVDKVKIGGAKLGKALSEMNNQFGDVPKVDDDEEIPF